jgi:hypothetical protein
MPLVVVAVVVTLTLLTAGCARCPEHECGCPDGGQQGQQGVQLV